MSGPILTRRALLAGGVAAGASALALAAPVATAAAGGFRLAWSSDFSADVPLGSFPGPGWGCFHYGDLDTAARAGISPGGIYDPHTTTWVSGGALHVRMWRGSSGRVHCGTPYPLATRHVTYGRFIEVSRVSRATVGYKSAHLLWSQGRLANWEVDWPENNWAGIHATPHGYDHYEKATSHPQRLAWPTGYSWQDWHTYEIRWRPGLLALYIDGTVIGRTSLAAAVPAGPMAWNLQNESADIGAGAAPNSSAQIDTRRVEYWAWVG